MFRNRSVQVHHFSITPRADIPRSAFLMEKGHKTTFDAGYLIPIYCNEVLPADTWTVRATIFARMATPLFPIMDNVYLDSFFFFVPCRLVWDNWVKFMGEQRNPGDSIDYTIPQQVSPASGYAVNSLQDYFGLPTVGQLDVGATKSHNALPLRAYNLIWNEWFRDENLQDSLVVDVDDGPDTVTDYVLRKRGKRHDYFTSCLPWPQKGDTAVSLPLGTTAPVVNDGTKFMMAENAAGTTNPFIVERTANTINSTLQVAGVAGTTGGDLYFKSGLHADLTAATAATINQLRQSFQIQKLIERDGRGGTRYTEIIRAHFGVISPDQRLQRPEYLGGGSSRVVVNPIAQTSGTSASGTTTPLGELAGVATAVASGHGFSQSFTEHGYIIGLVSVRADLTYQQGLKKMWSRSTRYDFYFPAFAMLGEQAVLTQELYCDGSATDDDVFGYQERWAEYRYDPSMVTGLFRSTAAGAIDGWHLAQEFASVPLLDETFIQDTPPLSRVLAVGASANGKQFLCDALFSAKVTRAMPMYSVPGLIDHF